MSGVGGGAEIGVAAPVGGEVACRDAVGDQDSARDRWGGRAEKFVCIFHKRCQMPATGAAVRRTGLRCGGRGCCAADGAAARRTGLLRGGLRRTGLLRGGWGCCSATVRGGRADGGSCAAGLPRGASGAAWLQQCHGRRGIIATSGAAARRAGLLRGGSL